MSVADTTGTVNNAILHQHNEHQMITRLALGCTLDTSSDGTCFETASLSNLAGDGTHNGAVGSPDDLALTPEGPEAHCDDADFMDVPGYPQTREEATAKLQSCVDHLRMRFRQGVTAAGRMIDDKNNLIPEQTSVFAFAGYCEFKHRETTENTASKAKCAALEGLGRALHGTQDFYSHSNWADQNDAIAPLSVKNPPGINRGDTVPFFDLRATGDITLVPHDLTTGCFSVAEFVDSEDGSFMCKDRVIHARLNKDHGIISLDGSFTPDTAGSPRNAIPNNFAKAVRSAVADTRARWKNFRDELHAQHGPEKANLLVCAMIRDYPAKYCRNRKIAIVIDSSGSNLDTDPANLRISAAKLFNARLTTAAQARDGVIPDKVAVIDFDSSARVLYSLGDPAGASSSFDAIDSAGGTNIGSGIALGIDEILKDDEPGAYAKRAGIVVLTDGEDNSPANQVAQLARAREMGIRVNYGFLSPPLAPTTRKRGAVVKRGPGADVVAAILSTGGTYGVIESAAAQRNFIDLVVARGVTDIDAAIGTTVLKSGISVVERVNADKTAHDFTYTASPGEMMTFNTTVLSGNATLQAILRDVRNNSGIITLHRISTKPTSFSLQTVEKTLLEFVVSARGNMSSGVVFSVGLSSSLNGTGACLAKRSEGVVVLGKRQYGNGSRTTTVMGRSTAVSATLVMETPKSMTVSC